MSNIAVITIVSGSIVTYMLSAAMTSAVISHVLNTSFKEGNEDERCSIVFGGVFWPISWIVLAVKSVYSFSYAYLSRPKIPEAKVVSTKEQ